MPMQRQVYNKARFTQTMFPLCQHLVFPVSHQLFPALLDHLFTQ